MTPTNPPEQTINHPAHTLLQNAHPPAKSDSIFLDKIKNKPLLLHPTKTSTGTTSSPSTTNTSRTKRRKIRAHKARYHLHHQRPRPLSAKEKRQSKIHQLAPDEIKYEIYTGLNRLWTGYMLEVLGFTTRDTDGGGGTVVVHDVHRKSVRGEEQGSLIASADFHGMEVEVVRCRDVGRVGVKGIVVRETKGTMVVVSVGDRVRTIMKDGAVFRVVLELPVNGEKGGDRNRDTKEETVTSSTSENKRKLVFDLIGSQLLVRPMDRATKRFKWHTVK